MMGRTVENSPRFYARIGGVLYLSLILLGLFAEVARIAGRPALTVAHPGASEMLWRLGTVAEYAAIVSALGLAMIYYVLLEPVSRELNLVATFLRLVALSVQAVAVLNLDLALVPLRHPSSLSAFTPEQIEAVVGLTIRAHDRGYGLALLLFGTCFLIHGRLIFRSGFLPRVLGVLIQIAGVCYTTNSLLLFLAPGWSWRFFGILLPPCFIAEVSLAVWLTVKGVDEPKWKQSKAQAVANAGSALACV